MPARFGNGSGGAAFLDTLAVSPPLPTVFERQVQIRSVDFEHAILELFNFSSADFDLSGWRFCSHDFDQALRYTAPDGFDGVTIQAGTSLFVHFDNDAPAGDPDRIDRSSLGGAFALPLDTDAYGLQLFFPVNGGVSFGNSAQIADHVQWNLDGAGVGSAEQRTGQAVAEGLWSAVGDFVATEVATPRIELNDLSGDFPGSPPEYAILSAGGLPGESADLRVSRSAGDVQLSWSPDCAGSSLYNVYRGDLTAGYASIEQLSCGLSGTSISVPIGPAAGEFFLVVPEQGGLEGSYGRTSNGLERSTTLSACRPQGEFASCVFR